MTRWLRASSIAALLLLLVCRQAVADDATRAEQLNDKGKERIALLDLEGAAELFRQAIALSDDPRFHFNLCFTLEKAGKLSEARDACDVALGSGVPRLQKKAAALLAKIDERLGPRPTLPPEPGPTGTHDAPNASGPGQSSAGVPPPPPPPKKAPDPGPKVSYGVVAGASLATYSGASEANQVAGLAAGGWMLVPMGNGYELVLDLQFVQRGASFRDDGLSRLSMNTGYVDVGAAFRYRLNPGVGALSYYFDAGLVASLLVASSVELDGVAVADEDLNTKDLASVFAVGAVIDTGGGAIDLRLRYMIGYLAVNEERSSAGLLGPKLLNRTILLQGGYWF